RARQQPVGAHVAHAHVADTFPVKNSTQSISGAPPRATGRNAMTTLHAISAAIVTASLCLPLAARAADPLPRAKPEDVGMSSARLALIGNAVNAEIARDQLPGAVLVIARRGKIVYFETFGYRDKAAGAPMPADAIFNIASMTKPMVAVAALQLYEQGKILM